MKKIVFDDGFEKEVERKLISTVSVRLVGPMAPATKRGLFGVFFVTAAVAFFASFAAALGVFLTCFFCGPAPGAEKIFTFKFK